MKTSNLILSISFLILVIVAIGRASYVKNYVGEEYFQNLLAPTYAEGAYLQDTMIFNYSHLVTDHFEVELDMSSDSTVIFNTFENMKDLVTFERRNDTLYIKRTRDVVFGAKSSVDSIVRAKTGGNEALFQEYMQKYKKPSFVKVGARMLKSLTVSDRGHVEHPSEFKPGYKQDFNLSAWNHMAITTPEFNLKMDNGGTVNLIFNNQAINIESTGTDFNRIYLRGKTRRLEVQNEYTDIWGLELNTDTLYYKDIIERVDLGHASRLRFKVNEYLNADLHGLNDLVYKGNPRLEKAERSYGRLVNANYYGDRSLLTQFGRKRNLPNN